MLNMLRCGMAVPGVEAALPLALEAVSRIILGLWATLTGD